MLNYHNNRSNIFYCILGILSLCGALGLMVAIKNAGKLPGYLSPNQVGQRSPAFSLSVDVSVDEQSVNHGLQQVKPSLEQVYEAASAIECTTRCRSTLSMLEGDLELDDDAFHQLGAFVKEIAAYLQGDEVERERYLQMALTTSDADKRGFLTDIFYHLPYQQKLELSEAYIASEDWQARADGVTLIADHEIPSVEVATRLMDIFSAEDNSYIKGSILSHLKQRPDLQGDFGILYQLDSAIYNDTLAGLIAIEQVLQNEQEYSESSLYIDKDSFKKEFEMIQNLAIYEDDQQRFDHLISEANLVYSRYFNY